MEETIYDKAAKLLPELTEVPVVPNGPTKKKRDKKKVLKRKIVRASRKRNWNK